MTTIEITTDKPYEGFEGEMNEDTNDTKDTKDTKYTKHIEIFGLIGDGIYHICELYNLDEDHDFEIESFEDLEKFEIATMNFEIDTQKFTAKIA